MLDAWVQKIRAEQPDTLLLDAGDMMTGNPISRIPVEGVAGWGLFSLMNIVGYDAWELGNHDFDQGQENLHEILARLGFPTLSANLGIAPTSPIAGDVKPFVILRVGGLRVGVVGLMTPELGGLLHDGLEGIEVADPVATLQDVVRRIDPETDLIVVLSHMGDEADRALAAAVSGVDVIVGGHSHQRIYPPERVGEVIVVQAGSNLRYLGRLDLVVARDRVVRYEGALIPLWVRADLVVSPAMREGVSRARRRVAADYGEPLGELQVAWVRNYRGESNVGDWIADQMRRRAGADVAFLNSGGIRNNLPAGRVTKGDLVTVLPFENRLCTFEATGADLVRIVEANARAAVERTHGILQVSGLRYTFTVEGDGVRVTALEVGGHPVEPERVYLAATNDYMLFSQPEKYFPGVTPGRPKRLDVTLLEVAVEAFRREGRVEARVDGRIEQE